MRLNANQLSTHLKAKLAPAYLVAGDEPMLVDECCTAVRAAARTHGYHERALATAAPGFDWDAWFRTSQSPSLFSPKRLLELRLANSGPGEAGADALVQVASKPPPDIVLLVSAPRLDKRAQGSRWVKALEAAGVLVIVYPLARAELPRWLERRMRAAGLAPATDVAQTLAYHFEGNLLGAAQEVDKLLMLHGSGPVSLDDIRDDLSDNARFNVFNLVDACLQGDAAAAARMLASMRSEGTEPLLVLKLLAREARMLAQISLALLHGQREGEVLEEHRVWPRRRTLVMQALRRGRAQAWLAVLQRAARAERILKGRLAGDIWQELQCLVFAMCGLRVHTCGRRVPQA